MGSLWNLQLCGDESVGGKGDGGCIASGGGGLYSVGKEGGHKRATLLIGVVVVDKGGGLIADKVGENGGASSRWSIAKHVLCLGGKCFTSHLRCDHKKCNRIRVCTCEIFLNQLSITMSIVVSNTHPFSFFLPRDFAHPLLSKLKSVEMQ